MLVLVPMPLPDKAIDVGLLLALLVILTAPVRAPEVVGVNLTVTVQEAPTVRLEQLLVWLKSPVVETAEMVAVVVPELDTDTAWVADEVPTIVLAQERLVGLGVRIRPCGTPRSGSATALVM